MPTEESKAKHVLFSGLSVILGIAGLAHIIYGCVLTWRGEITSSAAAIGIGLSLTLFAMLDRFEAVKGLGIEARLRKVDDKIVEADRILDQVRRLAELTGRELIASAAKMGRWDSAPSPQKLYELASTVRALLDEAGSPREVVMSALAPWTRVMAFELCNRLFVAIRLGLAPIEVRLRNEMNSLDQGTPGYREKHAHLSNRLGVVSEAASRAKQIGSLHADQIRSWLREQVRTAPELTDDDRQVILDEFAEWDEAIRVLVGNAELDNPQRWFAKLEEPAL